MFVPLYVHKMKLWKPERKRPLRRPGRRWEDNISWTLWNRMWRCGLDWSGSGWGPVGAVMKTVMILRVQ